MLCLCYNYGISIYNMKTPVIGINYKKSKYIREIHSNDCEIFFESSTLYSCFSVKSISRNFSWNCFHGKYHILMNLTLSFFLLFIRESDYKQLWRRGHLIEKQCTECFSLFESAVDLNNFGGLFVRHEKSRTLASILKLTLIEHCFVLFYTTGTIL